MTEKPDGSYDPVDRDDQPTKIMAGDKDPQEDDTLPFVSVAASLVGQTLSDRYAVEGELGRGGMGVVYRGRNRSIDRPVAIKVLDVNLLNSNTSKKRFEQEAKASANLEHPNLVSVFDYGFGPNGEPYIVMELLNGESLDRVLKQQGPFSIERFSHVFKQVCKALGHVHKRGLIHRDIKPGNIMLISTEDDPDFVKLVDFGIAKVVPQDGRTIQRLTATGQSFGSPLYMSPEQCMGQEVDQRSDVYSLGCVMYEMLTGVPPIQGENPLQTLFAHVNSAPIAITKTATGSTVPPKFEAILMKMLEKKPDDRFQSIAEVSEELSLDAEGKSSSKSKKGIRDKKSATDGNTIKEVVPASDGEGNGDTSTDTGGDTDTKAARDAEEVNKGPTPPNAKLRISLVIAAVMAFLVIAPNTPVIKPFVDKYYEDSYQREIAQAKQLFDKELYGNALAEYRALKPKVESTFGDDSKQMADLFYRTAQANRKNNSNPKDSKETLILAKDILVGIYDENAPSEQLYGLIEYELGRAYEAYPPDFSRAIKEYEEALKTLDRASADRSLISELRAHLGISLAENRDYSKAQLPLLESLDILKAQSKPDYELIAQANIALSKAYAGQGEYDKALGLLTQIRPLISKAPAATTLLAQLDKQDQAVQTAKRGSSNSISSFNFFGNSSRTTSGILSDTQVKKPYDSSIKINPGGITGAFGTINSNGLSVPLGTINSKGLTNPLGTMKSKGLDSPFGTIGPDGLTIKVPAENRSGSLSKMMVESSTKPQAIPSWQKLQPSTKLFPLQSPRSTTQSAQPKQDTSVTSPFRERPAGTGIRSQVQQRLKMRLNGETPEQPILDNLRRSSPPFPPLPTAR